MGNWEVLREKKGTWPPVETASSAYVALNRSFCNAVSEATIEKIRLGRVRQNPQCLWKNKMWEGTRDSQRCCKDRRNEHDLMVAD